MFVRHNRKPPRRQSGRSATRTDARDYPADAATGPALSTARDRPPRSSGSDAADACDATNACDVAAGTKTLSDVEMEYILSIYAKNNYNKQVTATELGISLKTLYNKLHKYEEELRMRHAG